MVFSWSQLRPEIHPVFCSSSALFLLAPLPRCLLELSLESDLYYLSLTLSPQLCLFLRLNEDLDKRVSAAREQPLNTKRHTKGKREEAREEQRAGARFTEPFAPCLSLLLRLKRFPVIYQTSALGSKCCLTVTCSPAFPLHLSPLIICMQGRTMQAKGWTTQDV